LTHEQSFETERRDHVLKLSYILFNALSVPYTLRKKGGPTKPVTGTVGFY